MVLTHHLVGAVAHQVQKELVGPQHTALQVKFDHRLHMFQRGQQCRRARGLPGGGRGLSMGVFMVKAGRKANAGGWFD